MSRGDTGIVPDAVAPRVAWVPMIDQWSRRSRRPVPLTAPGVNAGTEAFPLSLFLVQNLKANQAFV